MTGVLQMGNGVGVFGRDGVIVGQYHSHRPDTCGHLADGDPVGQGVALGVRFGVSVGFGVALGTMTTIVTASGASARGEA